MKTTAGTTLRLFKSGLAVFLVVFSFQGALADEAQITPSIAVQGDYNDNILLDSADELSDYRFIITPGLALTSRTERLDSNLRFSFPIYEYVDLEEFNAVDQSYLGGLRYQWTPRFAASVQASYIRDSQPDRDLLETGLALGINTRARIFAGLSGEYSLSEVTSAALSYAYSEEEFSSPGNTDSTSHTINLVFTRNMEKLLANTHGRLTFSGTRYEFTPSTFDSPKSVSENYSAMVGAVRRLTELYTFSVDLGVRYTRREFDAPRLQAVAPGLFRVVTESVDEDDMGGVGRVVLSYQDESLRASLTAYQDVGTSGGAAGLVQRTAFVGDVGKRFTYRLWGHFAAGYYLNDSKGRDLSLQQLDEETWRINPYLRYEYSLDLSFEASYSFTRLDDRIDNTPADRNLFFIRVVYYHQLLK